MLDAPAEVVEQAEQVDVGVLHVVEQDQQRLAGRRATEPAGEYGTQAQSLVSRIERRRRRVAGQHVAQAAQHAHDRRRVRAELRLELGRHLAEREQLESIGQRVERSAERALDGPPRGECEASAGGALGSPAGEAGRARSARTAQDDQAAPTIDRGSERPVDLVELVFAAEKDSRAGGGGHSFDYDSPL